MNLRQISDEAWLTAEDHGWHEVPIADLRLPVGLMRCILPLGRAIEADRAGERGDSMLEEAAHLLLRLTQDRVPEPLPGVDPRWEAGMMMAVTELCEAARAGTMTDQAEELADVIIRLADTARTFHLDLDLAVSRKLITNAGRPPKHGGKKY